MTWSVRVENQWPAGTVNTEVGKYVVVWKKQPDKQWKVIADIFIPTK